MEMMRVLGLIDRKKNILKNIRIDRLCMPEKMLVKSICIHFNLIWKVVGDK